MKKQFIGFGGGLAVGLALFALVPSQKELPEMQESMSILNVALPDFAANQGFVEVPLEEFFGDVARYRTTHVNIIEPTMPAGRRPSRMFIYSINVLDNFFGVIKKAGRKLDIPDKKLAIRFYYGVYPEGTRIHGRDYSGLHTLFMSPNYWSTKYNCFMDFDIAKLAEDKKANQQAWKKEWRDDPEKVIERYFYKERYDADPNAGVFMLDATAMLNKMDSLKAASFFQAGTTDFVVTNQGQLCPPNCPSRSLLKDIDQMYPDPTPGP